MAGKKTLEAKPIVLLSGPPGAGKTTVADRLVELSPGPVVLIEGDLFWTFGVKGPQGDPPRLGFRTVMAAMTTAAVPFAMAGHETIIDFSIPPWFVPLAMRIAGARDIPLDYVVLRPKVELCAARAAGRSEGRIEDDASYREFYATFDDAPPASIVDEDGTPDGIAARVRKGLDAKTFRIQAA